MCQYLDLLADDSYIKVNRKLVKLVGLQAAAYWAEIIEIAPHVKKKKTANTEGYWKLDRDYVEARTGITIEDQLTCDSLLTNLGILEEHPADPNMIGIRLDDYIKIIIDDNVKQLDLAKKTVKVSRAQTSKNKKDGLIITMKKLISETDPDVKASYDSWVESVYASGKGFLNKAKIQMLEDAINTYTTDKSTKLEILNAAIQTGYTEPSWIINRYETTKKSTSSRLSDQRVSTGINTEIKF